MPEKLTSKRVSDAIAAGTRADYRDIQAPGLMLRVWAVGRWGWGYRKGFRGRDYRLDLGNEWTLDEAREIAIEATRRFKSGDRPILGNGFRGPDPSWERYLVERRAKKAGAKAPPPAPAPAPPRPQSREWRAALPEWIVEVERTRRQSTADGYRRALNVAEFQVFISREVCTITRAEIAEALLKIARRGAERQAELTCSAVKGFFGWMGADAQNRRTGVAEGLLVGLEPPERTLDETTPLRPLHVPSAREVGRIMRWLRDEASAPERDRLAGLLLVYSAQRRGAVAAARKADFEAVPRVGGGLWKMPAQHRKTASIRRRRGLEVGAHVVPLPPTAWAVVERAIATSDGDHLFMPTRDRRAAQPSSHMDPSTLTHMFGDIPGCTASPHDMRRAFGTTYARVARLKVSDVKVILDHAEGVPHGDVTATHYAFLDGTHEKWPIMNGYVDWVDQCAAADEVKEAAE